MFTKKLTNRKFRIGAYRGSGTPDDSSKHEPTSVTRPSFATLSALPRFLDAALLVGFLVSSKSIWGAANMGTAAVQDWRIGALHVASCRPGRLDILHMSRNIQRLNVDSPGLTEAMLEKSKKST